MDNNRRVSIRRGNTKLGKVLNISLPPGVSCRAGAPCLNTGCYAMKFYKLRKECKKAWDNNYKLAMEDREYYFGTIRAKIALTEPKMFRWHVSGDIPDLDYLLEMEYLACVFPDVAFLVFTKRYEIVKEYLKKCDKYYFGAPNLNIVLSTWPGLDIPWPLRHMPTAWMRDPSDPDPRIPETASECDGGCDKCGLCWNLKQDQSVVFNKH